MAKNLVIVESPAKAKTIEGFLGKEFKVESCFGHIRDLVSKDMGIDIDKGFEPIYEVSKDKKDVVNKLKKLSKEADIVWLASDEDREGEAISWHLVEALGLDVSKTKRIVFHEITKTAIQKAIENPRTIDYNLVNAQQARRVLDRLVGFEISPVLWRKVKAGLSAGRVQSVAVRLIVEREREIINFKTESSYRVVAQFETSTGETFQAELPKRFKKKEEAEAFLNDCKDSTFNISSLETKPAKKSPAAPFTTSTLQQEASRKLGFSVSRTMTVAQKLYEAGLITYMRTDSVNLSDDAKAAAKAEITSSYGANYSQPRNYSTKSKGAQEAHEAIRPTYMQNHTAGKDDSEKRLYDLIWKRTLASQMSEAQLERTTAHISVSGNPLEFTARGEMIKFDGFLKVYLEGTDDEDLDEQKGMLPKLAQGDKLNADDITATERFTKHPPRYTEASLVKKLEELGIGRPSTYAPTISTIQRRDYVEKTQLEGIKRNYNQLILKAGAIKDSTLTENTGADKGKLAPTDIGMVVNDFLVEHFKNVLDFNFTASVEEEFDSIANGQKEWNSMIESFYSDFHTTIEDVKENSERASGERLLGTDPKTGKNLYVRIGRYGPMAQIGESDDEEKKFAGLLKTQHIESITLEEALELFKLPRDLGLYEEKKVVVGVGRFGPYVRHDGKFVSIKKDDGDDPLTIELDRAIELIEAKRKADAEKFIAKFDEEEPVIEVLKGRWGPYIKIGKKNVKIPKDVDPTTLTREDCLKLEKEAPKKTNKRTTRKKS